MKPRLLDLFSCAGGAGMGYSRAGFEVVGVDIDSQPRYPFEFHQGDALKYLLEHHDEFDAFHASPPCQAWTLAQRIQNNTHPDYVAATRAAFELIGKPWVIENVVGSPLRDPITLCGGMFPGLRVYRHRLFESNVKLTAPEHPEHVAPVRKMGRQPLEGEFMHVVGNFAGVEYAKRAMGIDWMVRDELREAIPPAFTQHLGTQLLTHLKEKTMHVSRDNEPPADTWVKDRWGGTHHRGDNGGWGSPGFYYFGRWTSMWDARGPLAVCEPWGVEVTVDA